MFRRIFFVSILPLLSTRSSRRAAIGVFAAVCSSLVFRELEPFERPFVNTLAHVGQLMLFFTYGAALCIATDVTKKAPPALFGAVLIVANTLVLGLALAAGVRRAVVAERARRAALQRLARGVDWACDFSSEKFATTFAAVRRACVPPTQVGYERVFCPYFLPLSVSHATTYPRNSFQ